MARPVDDVQIEAAGVGAISNLTSIEITNDLMAPSEGAFELGNAGTWPAIAEQIAHGTAYKVFINGLLRLSGRVEMTDEPADANAGSVVRLVIRTKLADATFASAKPNIRTKNASIKQFILQLYKALGYVESDFVFSPATARDLLSGKSSGNAGGTVDLEPMTEEELKVNPPESIYDAADRILRRFGLMHWDSPDGRIVVGAPTDTKAPLYYLRMNTGTAGQRNNLTASTPTQDWSGVPSSVTVVGSKKKKGTSRTRVAAVELEGDVAAAGFYRPVVIPAEGVRSTTKAARAAAREMSARRRNMDQWPIEVDGLSYWDGSRPINWAVDEVAQIESDWIGRPPGAYYIFRVICRRDAQTGDKTNLVALRKGLWTL